MVTGLVRPDAHRRGVRGSSYPETCRVRNSDGVLFIPFSSAALFLFLPSSLRCSLIMSHYVLVSGDIELKTMVLALEEFTFR